MKWMLSFLLLASLTCLGQTSTLRVTLPFDFVAADHQYPAGQYEVRYTAAMRWVVLESPDTNATTHLMPQTIDANVARPAGSRLVFYKYGTECFLRGVSFHEGQLLFEFGPNKDERTRLRHVRLEISQSR